MSLDDETARILEGIAESFDRTADIMQTAAKTWAADGRPLLNDYAQASADSFRLAAEHVRETAAAPADQRVLVGSTLVVLRPSDVEESTHGRPLEVNR